MFGWLKKILKIDGRSIEDIEKDLKESRVKLREHENNIQRLEASIKLSDYKLKVNELSKKIAKELFDMLDKTKNAELTIIHAQDYAISLIGEYDEQLVIDAQKYLIDLVNQTSERVKEKADA